MNHADLGNGVRKAVFILIPRFSAFELTALVKVFQIANRELGYEAFSWTFASQTGGIIRSSDGFLMETIQFDQTEDCDLICVLAAFRPLDDVLPPFLDWLRQKHRHGIVLAGVESGTFLLAKAGVLGAHKPALHQEDIGAFLELWPRYEIAESTLSKGQGLLTSVGCSAAIDLGLSLVSQRFGPQLAHAVANIIYYAPGFAPSANRIAPKDREPSIPDLFKRCHAMMTETIAAPLAVSEIADALEINPRRLHRMVRKYTGMTPQHYYRALRLTEAHFMLINSNFSITDVALACGYASSTAFTKAFRAHFGYPPSHNRQPYTGAAINAHRV